MKWARCGYFLALALIVVFAGFDPAAGQYAKVRVAVQPSPAAMPIYVAQRQGYFRDAGLIAKIVPGRTSEKALRKLVEKKVDLAMADYAHILKLVAEGLDLAIASNLENARKMTPDGLVLLTRKDVSVINVKGLEGKQVAIGKDQILARVAVLDLLRSHKADTKTVTFRPFNLRELQFAFQRREISAVVVPEPYVTMITSEQQVREFYYPYVEMEKGLPLTGLAAHKQWAERFPVSVDRLIAGLEKAVIWLTRDRRNAWAVLQEWLMFDEQVAEKMLLNGWSTRLNPDHLQRIADALLREKMTNRPITASALLLREKRITRR